MKEIEIYSTDLTEEAKKRILKDFGVDTDNSSWDIFSIEGYYDWIGEASSKEEAENIALDKVGEMNFGDLQNVDLNIAGCEEE